MIKEGARERRLIALIERDYMRAIDVLLREPQKKIFSSGEGIP